MENAVFLRENAWFSKCMQKNPRFTVFFAMHSLTCHEWMMDDALCVHMENAVFLGKTHGFENAFEKKVSQCFLICAGSASVSVSVSVQIIMS